MALVLVREDGTGRPDANSYADVAGGDSYHDGHLYASALAGSDASEALDCVVVRKRHGLGTVLLEFPANLLGSGLALLVAGGVLDGEEKFFG